MGRADGPCYRVCGSCGHAATRQSWPWPPRGGSPVNANLVSEMRFAGHSTHAISACWGWGGAGGGGGWGGAPPSRRQRGWGWVGVPAAQCAQLPHRPSQGNTTQLMQQRRQLLESLRDAPRWRKRNAAPKRLKLLRQRSGCPIARPSATSWPGGGFRFWLSPHASPASSARPRNLDPTVRKTQNVACGLPHR